MIKAFSSKNWESDPPKRKRLRAIFNQFLGFPEANANPFANKELVFDENANKI